MIVGKKVFILGRRSICHRKYLHLLDDHEFVLQEGGVSVECPLLMFDRHELISGGGSTACGLYAATDRELRVCFRGGISLFLERAAIGMWMVFK